MCNGVEVNNGGVLFLSLMKPLFGEEDGEGDDRMEEVVDSGEVGRC